MARQLVVELVGRADKYRKSLDDAGKATTSFGEKVAGAGKKMTAFVSVPVVGFLGAATKAAVDDAAAQEKLAKTLQNTTGATTKQVAGVEKQLEAMMKVSTFTDDDLRPAMARLVTSTKDADEATKLLSTAMDIAAATGKPLQTVSEALAKAHDGQTGALSKLGIQVKDVEGKTLSFEEIMRNANETFGGQAASAAETTAGKMQILKRDLGETAEKVGAELLPAVEKMASFFTGTLLPALDGISGNNGALVLLGVAAAGPVLSGVSKLKEGVLLLNGALTTLAANPGLVALALLATQLPKIKSQVESIGKTTKKEGVLAGVEEFIFGDKGIGRSGWETIKDAWPFAEGGVVTRPTLGLVGEAGPEAVIPLSKAGGLGGTTVVVNVAGSVISERDLVDAVHTGLLAKQRRSGNLGIVGA